MVVGSRLITVAKAKEFSSSLFDGEIELSMALKTPLWMKSINFVQYLERLTGNNFKSML